MKRHVYILEILLFLMVSFSFVVGADRIASLKVLKKKVEDEPENGDAWVKLGFAHLEAGKIKDARKAFDKGLEYAKSAEAYTGLGMVYTKMDRGMREKAFQAFRMALGVDPKNIATHMEIARWHVALGEVDAEAAFKRVIAIDPSYAPVYLEFMDWYANRDYYTYQDELTALCKRYIALVPDDTRGHYRLAIMYAERKQFAPMLEIAKPMFTESDDAQWLPLMVQALATRGSFGQSLRLFIRFLDSIPETERAYYDDISLVASKEELAEFEALENMKRFPFLRRFWSTREGALMLGGDARRVEHYRRVWFARTFFGKVNPWDKRGEVYIRYGEPNYRSRSGYPNVPPPPGVLLFKQRKIATLMEKQISYRAEEPTRTVLPMMYMGNTYYPGGNYDGSDNPEIIDRDDVIDMSSSDRIRAARDGAVFETDPSALPTGWLWEVMGPGGTVHLNVPPGLESGIEPAIPIDRDASGSAVMPWESWVYLGIGNDMEFVFTDRYMHGDWDFPLTPTNLWHSQLVIEVNNTQPGVVLMQMASQLPEYFDVPPGTDLLEFYYDLASFQGDSGLSKLEVYFGIPPEQVELLRDGDRVQMEVERALVLADVNGDSVYRVEDELVFRKSVEEVNLIGLFVVKVLEPEDPFDSIVDEILKGLEEGK